MSVNIIETIQKNLEYPALQKIDPNIQETKDKYVPTQVEKLAQAAIPAVLAGLYRLARNEVGANKIIQNDTKADWLKEFYSDKEEEAVQKVAQYAATGEAEAKSHMENIATEAVRILKKDTGDTPTPVKVKKFMDDQRHNILVYLPATMAIGDLLNDDALDDRTNKMEGPISNLMHKIEDKLSGGGS
ncbi:MAG: hypothetical protein H7Y01_02725 [Ferruginibacter sp.]|nr:hypothetical protein [Chitinophagaceae bacterium]